MFPLQWVSLYVGTYTLCQNGLFKKMVITHLEALHPFKYFYRFVGISDMKMHFPIGLEILEPTAAPSAIYLVPLLTCHGRRMVVFALQIATWEVSLGSLQWGLPSVACVIFLEPLSLC